MTGVVTGSVMKDELSKSLYEVLRGYYGPSELNDENGNKTGTYHYTWQRKSGIQPIGYCAGTPPTTKEEWDEMMVNSPDWGSNSWEEQRALDRIEEYRDRVEEYGDKYHEDGHETWKAARQCYTNYCLDLKLEFEGEELSVPIEGEDIVPSVEGEKCPHPDCETFVGFPTARILPQGFPKLLYLCSDHHSREAVEEFWQVPVVPMESY